MTDSSGDYVLTKHIEVFVDESSLLTVKQILTPEYSRRFYHINGEAPSFSASSAAVWVRMAIIDSSTAAKDWYLCILYPPIENIIVYSDSAAGNIVSRHWNRFDIPEQHLDFARFPIFPLVLQHHEPVRVLIRLRSNSSIPLLMKVRTKEEQLKSDRHDRFMLGGFYGMLLIMVIYNLFLYFSIRDRAYLFYVLYACSFGFYQSWVDGLIQAVFHWIPSQGMLAATINSYLFVICGFLFTREFLNTKTLIPKFDRIIKLVLLLFIILVLLMFFLPLYIFNDLAILIGGTYLFIYAIAGILTLRLHYRPAKFYLVAVAGFSVALMVRMLRLQGIIPMTEIAQNSLQVGFLWEVTLFSLALGDRYNTLREEKEKEKESIRTQIAQDLHDDVSATLSSISFFANAIKKLSRIRHRESQHYLEQIAESANKAKENITDIVWSIETTNGSWESLLSKFERFASDMFESMNIDYKISIQKEISKNIFYDQKQQVWLVMKELVTNICRHSQATKASIVVWVEKSELHITIQDNGKGFTTDSVSSKNHKGGGGIFNVPKRVQLLHGRHECISSPGKGTQWVITIPLQ